MTDYNLAQIKSHASFPFTDFDNNPLSFLMLELYWCQLFKELMGKKGVDWEVAADAQMDGNPILSVASLLHKRKLRVIHKVNEENKPVYPDHVGEGVHYGLQAWLNDGNFNANAVNELVVCADLSSFAEQEAINLIRLHCIDLVEEEVVEKAIDEYEVRVCMPE